MTVNNSKSVINLKITRRASIILFLAFLILTYAAKIIKYPLLGMSQISWTILILIIFLLIMFLPIIFNYQYIYYADDGDTIIIRYYTTGFIPGKKSSVEISKNNFSGFTLEKKFFGLIQSIILYQRLKEGIAKYPPIYISALKRDDKIKILKSLNSSAPMIKGKS